MTTTTTATFRDPTATTTAGLVRRVAARAIDGLLLAATGLAVGGVIGFGWIWFVFQLVLVAAYFVGLDTLHGATLGKRLLGLRVVAGNGYRRPTAAEAARREAIVVLGAVPFVGPVLALIGFSAVAWSIHRGDAIHDRAAGTDVVRA